MAVRLWALHPGNSSLAEAVAKSTALGALDSWNDGIDSGRKDIDWIGEKLDADMPDVEIAEPVSLISRRASAVGLSYDRAFKKSKVGSSTQQAIIDNEYRLDRIATTENAVEFTTARRTIVATAVEAALIPLSKLVQIWDAQLDACEICKGLNGRKTNLGGTYDGQLPGSVHAHCRCIDTFEVV